MSNAAAIGIDIGGTNIRLALFSREGAAIERSEFSTRGIDQAELLLKRLAREVGLLAARAEDGGFNILGVGLGSAGVLDTEKGLVVTSPNIHFLDGFPLGKRLMEETGLTVRLENDANVFGLGEGWIGAARGTPSFLAMTLGTGVGGAVVLGGRLWAGVFGTSGEIGHMMVEPGGVTCGCGAKGCLETVAAPGWMAKRAEKAVKEGRDSVLRDVFEKQGWLTGKDLFGACQAEDPLAEELFTGAGRALGVAIVNVVNLLGLDLVVIGGGGAAGWDCFYPHLAGEMARRSKLISPERIRIVEAELGPDAGMIGAAGLFLMD